VERHIDAHRFDYRDLAIARAGKLRHMSGNVGNLILEHLGAMRGDISALRDDSAEIKSRLARAEIVVSRMRREGADLYADMIGQHARYGRLLDRIERIEKRLQLTPL
jgi:hypothetical protein